jgi:tetratricopeptide (TPR) repeat protein
MANDQTDLRFLLKQAIALQMKGDLSAAEAIYKKFLDQNPQDLDALNNLGVLKRSQKKFDEATVLLEKVIQINPNASTTWDNLGQIHQTMGQIKKSIHHYEEAIRLSPNFIEAHIHLGLAWNEMKEPIKGEETFKKVLEMNEQYWPAWVNLGNTYRMQGFYEKAIECFKKASAIEPHHPDVWLNKGLAFQDLNQYGQAIECYQKSLSLNPDHPNALGALALAQFQTGNVEKAEKYLDEAVKINPHDYKAHFHKGLVLIAQKKFREGWAEYEWRLKGGEYKYLSLFSQPVWDGASLQNKNILVHGEQGIGDQLTYASCLNEVILQAKQTTIACHPKLVALFSNSFPNASVISLPSEWIADGKTHPLCLDQSFHFQIPMASLMKIFRNDVSSFPKHKGYLKAHGAELKEWRKNVSELGPGKKIGISWKSFSQSKLVDSSERFKGNIPLDSWADLLRLDGYHLINLQYGDVEEEIREVSQKYGAKIHDWPELDQTNNLHALAAVMMNCDLVISAHTTAYNLAGALGIPGFHLMDYSLGSHQPVEMQDEAFFPSITHIRQERLDDWEGVMKRVIRHLTR